MVRPGGQRLIDASLGRLTAAASWLVLPVTLLLFLQWPLRDVIQAWSREANDLAQWLFALYVSIALTAASRARAHLAADAFAQRHSAAMRDIIARAGALLFLVPWALFLLIAGWPMAAQSVRLLESFPETYNPGYFLVKASAWLLALLVLLQALLELARPRRAS